MFHQIFSFITSETFIISVILSNKHGTNEMLHELPNNLWALPTQEKKKDLESLEIRKTQENLKTS